MIAYRCPNTPVERPQWAAMKRIQDERLARELTARADALEVEVAVLRRQAAHLLTS